MNGKGQSFAHFLQAYGEANAPRLVYRGGADFGRWQKRFRAAVTRLRGPVPERVAPVAEVLAARVPSVYTS